jgi:uncharacterized protein (TIGR02246 family)
MKHPIFLIVVATVVLLLVGCAPKGPNPDEMIAAAKELDQRFLDAFNAQNADGVMDTYMNSPDVVSFPPGGQTIVRGWDAIKSAVEADFQNMKGARLTISDSHYEVAGNAVITWGLWNMTMPLPDGTTLELDGRYTDVKKEHNGKWVYAIDHASVPLPPPPPPASGAGQEP